MYSYMIELCTRKEKVWPYAGQPRRDIKFDFLFKFSFFSPATRLGVTANVRNINLLVLTVHTYT